MQSSSLYKTWDLDIPVEAYYTSLLINKFSIGTPGDGGGFSWLRLGLDHHSEGEMTVAHRFTRNLAQTFFGHYYSLPEVIAQSQVQYGKHLSMLKQQLDLPESIYNDHLFAGILAAVLYELIAVTTNQGWTMHTSALARIIEVWSNKVG